MCLWGNPAPRTPSFEKNGKTSSGRFLTTLLDTRPSETYADFAPPAPCPLEDAPTTMLTLQPNFEPAGGR